MKKALRWMFLVFATRLLSGCWDGKSSTIVFRFPGDLVAIGISLLRFAQGRDFRKQILEKTNI